MSKLITNDYSMLQVLSRFGIDLGFGEQSIGQVCEQSGVDVSTFLAVVNFLVASDRRAVELSTISLSSLVEYLRRSHLYFSEYRLPRIREKLMREIPAENPLSQVVVNYYDEYVSEVCQHVHFEESVVFKYAEDLIAGVADTKYKIESFEDHHHSMDQHLSDLKSIIIKYYPLSMTNELGSVLFDIFACERDLALHCQIEDFILIPLICSIEKSREGEL